MFKKTGSGEINDVAEIVDFKLSAKASKTSKKTKSDGKHGAKSSNSDASTDLSTNEDEREMSMSLAAHGVVVQIRLYPPGLPCGRYFSFSKKKLKIVNAIVNEDCNLRTNPRS